MKKIVYLMAVLALGACTKKQEIAISGEKSGVMEDKTPVAINDGKGVYKIGNPYQINGVWYYPKEDYSYVAEGVASWYGPDFHNGITANGELYDMHAMTAAHPTLPLPSIVRVTNLENGRSLIVRVNDRGPFVNDRIIDVSKRAAQLLGFHDQGTTKVKVEIMAMQSQALKSELTAQGMASNLGVNADTVDTNPIPAAPVVEQQPIVAPVANTAPKSIIKSAPTTTTLPKGYYVQVGAYGKYDNAKRVEDALNSIATTYVYQTTGNSSLYRVRLGTFATHDEAVNVLGAVKNKGYRDAIVVEESKPMNASIGQRFEESMR